MTIKAKPLEEDMFSLQLHSLKQKKSLGTFTGWVRAKGSGAHQHCPRATRATLQELLHLFSI